MFFQPVQISTNGVDLLQWFTRKPSLYGAIINFSGPIDGSIFFLIPKTAANEITANFLGNNVESIEEEQRKDTIKEALNMVGGNMLSDLDSEGLISLDIPQLISQEDLSPDKLQDLQGEIFFIETEDNRMVVGIRVQNLE